MNISKNNVLRETTFDYLKNLPTIPTPDVLENELLDKIHNRFHLENALKSTKSEKWNLPQVLPNLVIAYCLTEIYSIKQIIWTKSNVENNTTLAVYQDAGENNGIYVSDETLLNNLIAQFNPSITKKDVEEVKAILKRLTPTVKRCTDRDLIAVDNGIFNYATKKLEPFSPDYVFTSKSHVAYNPNAYNNIIYNTDDNTYWDVESWMQSLSDDEEIVEVLWEILGAIIRPNVEWGKSAWFYSNTGNNGKGTLCELMRNLCGEGAYTSITLSDFGKEFMLEPLTKVSAIIVDENDVGTYIDKAANLKAVITNDIIQINRKFKTPIAYQFFGFMVQCLNELPRIKDKSDSFYRRQLFIPFTKCFTGTERKYIKYDYLQRKDVLEYVLFKVLNMNYYTLSEPRACQIALNDYKEYNDPIRQFAVEILPQCTWDLLPFGFLYDLYHEWFKQNCPSGLIQSKNTFVEELVSILPNFADWECPNKTLAHRPCKMMDAPEPLIAKYDLNNWGNPHYHGNDIRQRCTHIHTSSNYKGIYRNIKKQVCNP